jgi:hypothetical protein
LCDKKQSQRQKKRKEKKRRQMEEREREREREKGVYAVSANARIFRYITYAIYFRFYKTVCSILIEKEVKRKKLSN